MQNIKIAPTYFIIKNVVKIKNVKKRKKRDINKKRKKRFLHLWTEVRKCVTELNCCISTL